MARELLAAVQWRKRRPWTPAPLNPSRSSSKQVIAETKPSRRPSMTSFQRSSAVGCSSARRTKKPVSNPVGVLTLAVKLVEGGSRW